VVPEHLRGGDGRDEQEQRDGGGGDPAVADATPDLLKVRVHRGVIGSDG
jgi:hypothetical protein